jgi:hypothetical protein
VRTVIMVTADLATKLPQNHDAARGVGLLGETAEAAVAMRVRGSRPQGVAHHQSE